MPRGKRTHDDSTLSRIGIDAHAIGSRAGGNETYMRELLFALREYAPRRDFVVYAQRGVSPTMLAGWPVIPLPRTSSLLRVPITLPRAVQRNGAQLLHVQYNAPAREPVSRLSLACPTWAGSNTRSFFTPGMRKSTPAF